MAFTKRVYASKKKVFIYGSGSISAFIAIMLTLGAGVSITASDDMFCPYTPCEGFVNITISNYSVCFGSTFRGITADGNVTLNIYKADMRYSRSNPMRWKPYEFKPGTCLNMGKHEFKINTSNIGNTTKLTAGYGMTGSEFLWVAQTNITKNVNVTWSEPKIGVRTALYNQSFGMDANGMNLTHLKIIKIALNGGTYEVKYMSDYAVRFDLLTKEQYDKWISSGLMAVTKASTSESWKYTYRLDLTRYFSVNEGGDFYAIFQTGGIPANVNHTISKIG